MNEIIDNIKKNFNLIDSESDPDNLSWVQVEKNDVVPLLSHMKHQMDFTHFVLLTVVDWIEDDKFQLNYLLTNHKKNVDLAIRSYILRENAEMETAHHLWQHIATFQREIKEMYGIDFPGSPGVDEAFLLEGWDDMPPMRRDFDTYKYSEETYFPRPRPEGQDPQQHMKQKLYPDEE